ncbi:MAG TPA: AbrB/MazE/SpoVT family DNA-binding domain-containing protein [Terriglobales bacterium]|nr:AbrB/MazE/SpoVT family DNA-binding domain-containing protein [Terriglobales bacterium]
MSDKNAKPPSGIARVFMHGRSQAVRLPKAFRLSGDKVRVKRMGQSLVLEPIPFDYEAMWAEIDRIMDGHCFLAEGRPEQPPMPPDDPLKSWN